jgi:hypothetical protein
MASFVDPLMQTGVDFPQVWPVEAGLGLELAGAGLGLGFWHNVWEIVAKKMSTTRKLENRGNISYLIVFLQKRLRKSN